MILCRKEILKLIKSKKVIISPPGTIGAASIDLSLDNKIRIFRNGVKIKIRNKINYKNVTKLVNISKGYELKPGELVLGITKETIQLSDNICGWLNSRSRFARLGLMSHITAPFIAPGSNGKQVLEIYNAGPCILKIVPNVRICQLILQRCEGNAKYRGKFINQKL